MRPTVVSLLLCLLAALASASPPPLPLDGFSDGIHHWRNANRKTEYARLPAGDVRGIADHILLYQRANGGWRENEDPLRILSEGEKTQIAADRARTDTSFDNRNTWPQIEYLAGAYRITGDIRYRDACLRGPAIDAWRREFDGPSIHREIEGDHFFIDQRPEAVIAVLNEQLPKLLPP